METIFILRQELGQVRSIDVVNRLGFSKPSVSVAVKNLREQSCILVGEGGFITLTQKGEQIAQSMYERHRLISRALIAIGVQEETAVEDSCRIEHVISTQTFEKLKAFLLQHGIV